MRLRLPANTAIRSLHRLFEEQVRRVPNAVAVSFQNQSLTYFELDQQANQIAHRLIGWGAGPEVPVGICLERSLDLAAAVLGVLKAGAVCIPLDPSYPQDRLALMITEAKTKLLLTQPHLLRNLPQNCEHTIFLDSERKGSENQSQENPGVEVAAENLAYLLFTSGSTGKPKGIAMPHGPLVNLVEWQQRRSLLSVGAKTLQFASLSFDVSFQEMFSTWCSGGHLVLIPESLRRDPPRLCAFLQDQLVERLFIPVVVLQQLAEAVSRNALLPISLREIIAAGEQLLISPAIATLFERLPACTLHNQYGPTESHVVTAYTLNGAPAGWPALPPIGCPITNAQIYVLDSQMESVPVGCLGELYIGGEVLARGYFRQPELTAATFLPNPFDKNGSARLYRTGDLARFLADGNIEFLGRTDQQVKVRGHRVELGEVESVLSRHAAIKAAVVVARSNDFGGQELVAYWVARHRQLPSTRELQTYLKQELPAFMLPATFVRLDSLPLTPSGKVDRLALPIPQRTAAGQQLQVTTAASIEQVITCAWQEVLQVEPQHVDENFFDLGGDSLSIVEVQIRLQEHLRLELPVTALFQYPTIRTLTRYLNREAAEESLLRPVGERGTWQRKALARQRSRKNLVTS